MKPIKIDDDLFYTVKLFSILVNKTPQTIRRLMHKGNRIRKLRFIYVDEKPFIYASEITDFPFTVSGRNNDDIYFYNKNGEVVDAK